MARGVPYDATKRALFRAASAPDLFRLGRYATQAAVCAELCRVAYLGTDRHLETVLSTAQLTLEAAISRGSGFAYVARREVPSLTALVFRGTSPDPRDLLTDIKFLPREWSPAGSVHRGFADALDAMWRDIVAALPSADTPVVMTGHSLGGALATLAASRRPNATLCTFGSPLVGNRSFTSTLPMTHARYQNCADIVCRLPEGLPGFTHAGTLHYIDRWGTVHTNPSKQFVVNDQRAASANYLARVACAPRRLCFVSSPITRRSTTSRQRSAGAGTRYATAEPRSYGDNG